MIIKSNNNWLYLNDNNIYEIKVQNFIFETQVETLTTINKILLDYDF